jgi:hypothetical protein
MGPFFPGSGKPLIMGQRQQQSRQKLKHLRAQIKQVFFSIGDVTFRIGLSSN